MKQLKLIYLSLFLLFPFVSFSQNTAFVQAAIDNQTVLPTATYTVTNLVLTHSFDMHGSTINFTGTGASFLCNVAGTTLSNGSLVGSTSVYNTSTQYGISISADNVTIDHVGVSSFPMQGIVCADHSNVAVTNCTIFNTGYIGVFFVANSGIRTGIVFSNNVLNRGPQGTTVHESCLLVRGQTGGLIQGAIISGNTITQAATPTAGTSECMEIRGSDNCQIFNNSFTGGTIGTSIVIGDTRIRNYNNTYQNQSQYAVEMGDVQNCSSINNTITSGKVGYIIDGTSNTSTDTIRATTANISGLTSYPIQVNTSVLSGLVIHGITATTVTQGIYIQKGSGVTMDSLNFNGNSTTYPIFLDTSPGNVTVSNSTFTGFTPKLFFFFKAALPALTVNNVVANNVTISPGTICYNFTPTNIVIGPNVSCNVIAAPIINYVPNSYTLFVNNAFPPINITSTGGAVSSYTISPALPPGMLFNTTTAQISGLPAAITPSATYTVHGINGGGSANATITIAVIDRAPNISYSPNSQTGIINASITNMSPNNTGGAVINYTISPALPTGLNFNTSTGVISGTSTVLLATTSFLITAFNSGGSSSTSISLTINPPIPNISYSPNTEVFPINVAITPMVPTNTGGAGTFSISPTLPTGLSLNTSTGVISGIPTVLSGVTVYTVSCTNISGVSNTNVTLSVINVIPPAPSISYTPNSHTYTLGVPITPISPVNVGGPATSYSVLPSLPSGLSLNTSNGTISGTPTALSTAVLYTITASNTGGNGTAPLTLTIIDVPPNISYALNSQIATINVAITNMVPTNTGGPVVSYTISPGLPTGLNFNTATGVISGTPTVLSPSTSYLITAFNTGGSSPVNVTISVVNAPPAIPSISYSPSTVIFTVGTPITPMLPTNVGGPATSFGISPSLPSGLLFNTSTGQISGTPIVAFSPTIFNVSGSNITGTAHTNVTLSAVNPLPSPPSITYNPSVVALQINQVAPQLVPINTGGAVVSYSVLPALPTGLNLNTVSGVINGTPTVLSPQINYVVTASNTGGTGQFTIKISVLAPAPGPIIVLRRRRGVLIYP